MSRADTKYLVSLNYDLQEHPYSLLIAAHTNFIPYSLFEGVLVVFTSTFSSTGLTVTVVILSCTSSLQTMMIGREEKEQAVLYKSEHNSELIHGHGRGFVLLLLWIFMQLWRARRAQ